MTYFEWESDKIILLLIATNISQAFAGCFQNNFLIWFLPKLSQRFVIDEEIAGHHFCQQIYDLTKNVYQSSSKHSVRHTGQNHSGGGHNGQFYFKLPKIMFHSRIS